MKLKRSLITLVLLSILLSGCAFFNALYNGWQAFNTGLKTEKRLYSSGSDSTEVREATKKNYQRAIDKAEKAISFYPKSHKTHDDAFFLKARALYQLGGYSEAINNILTLQKDYPESKRIPQSWLYLGMCYAQNGEYEKATEAYSYIIANYPELNKNQEILILKADLAISTRGKSEAVKFLVEALEKVTDPAKKIYILDRLAGIYLDLEVYDKVLEYTTQKPVFDKSYKDLYYSISYKEVEALKESKEFDKAMILVTSLLDSKYFSKHYYTLSYQKALLYIVQEMYEDAEKILEDIVTSTKTDEVIAKSWWELSKIRIDVNGDIKKGIESLEEILKISKDDDLRTLAQKRLGGLKDILVYTDSLSGTIPDSINSWDIRYKLGELYWLDARLPDSALVQFELILSDTSIDDSIKLKTRYSKAWILQEILNDSVKAKPILDSIIATNPATEEAKGAQKLLGLKVTLMTRADSANALLIETEKLKEKGGNYSRKVYYSYLLTALKYSDIDSIAAKAIYAAGWVVNKRPKGEFDIDTAAAKVFGRLCHDYPASDQCREATKLFDNGKVEGYIQTYNKFLDTKDSSITDSTLLDTSAIANDSISKENSFPKKKDPIVIPDFKSWF